MKSYWNLFWTFVKVSAFTIGGGMAMVAVVRSILVEKRKWMTDDEFMDILATQLYGSKYMFGELLEILNYNLEKIDVVGGTVDLGFDCPLDLYCTYSRDQILVAMDFMKPNTVREGTKWLEDKKVDVFFVTLNKSDKDYSPTTMYEDYSINEEFFHWQSQSPW